jgi:hypothetical protein
LIQNQPAYHPIPDPQEKEISIIAKENGIKIEFIRKASVFRKDDRINEILAERGRQEGMEWFTDSRRLSDARLMIKVMSNDISKMKVFREV